MLGWFKSPRTRPSSMKDESKADAVLNLLRELSRSFVLIDSLTRWMQRLTPSRV
jgi:hypothetical protein